MTLSMWLMVIVTWIILIDIHQTIKDQGGDDNDRRRRKHK